jgi:hypothetical protein
MAKGGRFVTDARAGAYCHITVESGEKLLVSHNKRGFKGGSITISLVKRWGLSSDTLYR